MAETDTLEERQQLAKLKARQEAAKNDPVSTGQARTRAFWSKYGLGGAYDFLRTQGEETAKGNEDLIRSVASGATFGFADELAAGASSLTGIGAQEGGQGDYESNLAAERARDEQIPLGTSITGNVIGGLATGSGLAKGAAAVAPGAVQAFSNLPGFTRAVLLGGGYGGAYGLGSGEGGTANRLASAGTGAAIGAATGALVYPAVKAAEKGIGAVAKGIQNRMGPKTAAQRKVLEAIQRDEMTPGKVSSRLRALGPQATLADAGGENLTGLARAAAGVPGSAKNRAAQTLNARASGEAGRITQKINQGLKPTDYFAAEDKFLAQLKSNARDLYQKAYAAGKHLESKNLSKLLERPVAKKAMLEAADLASINGRRLSQLDPTLTAQLREAVKLGLVDPSVVPKGGVGRGITTEAIDDLKRGLDAMIDKETNQLTGGLTKRGALLADFKRQLLREVDNLNPAYAAARKAYAGDAEVLTALREGRRALKLDPEEITRAMADMSESAKQAYRSGAARALKDIVDNTPDTTSAARRLFSKDVMRSRLRALFPDQDTFNALARTLNSEMRFQQVRNTVLGGSPTQPRLAEQADLGVDPGILQEAARNPGSFLGNVAREGYRRLTQPNPDLAQELSKILFSRNQSANQQAIDALLARQQVGQVSQRNLKAIEEALIRSLAQQEGRISGDIYSQRR